MRTTWTFHSAGQLLFGSGAAEQTGSLTHALGARRVLLVSDANLAKVGLVEPIVRNLSAAGIEVETFDGGKPEPSFELAEQAIEAGRHARPDAIVGLGGGSNMDLAKVVAAVLAHPVRLEDLMGENRIPGPVLPLVCLPTTSGTGSEVTAGAVLTDEARGLKIGMMSNYLRPRLAIVDPKLTLGCPRQVTADSGIDALVHAIEAFTAVDNATFPLPSGESSCYQGRNPLGDCLAERAITLVGQHLVRAVHEPKNLQAREGMALAATLAGLAFSNVGVALVHAMEYPLGPATHCSHGAGNGLLLPYVMRYNLPLRQCEFARVAELLGEPVAGLSIEAAAERSFAAVERIRREIGIPDRMRELGVREEQLDGFAEKAAGIKRILRVNPRFPTVAEIRQVYASAL